MTIDSAERKRLIRIRGVHSTPKASPETRVALIAAERGLPIKQMAKYWEQRRKNSKPLFDYWAFAEAQNISTDWLFDGDLRAHPRGAAPRLGRQIPTARELREKIEAMDEKGQQFMEGYIQALIDRRGKPDGDDAA
jgi:hypothetical protein